MLRLSIRFVIIIFLLIGVFVWYKIPDRMFVAYDDANQVTYEPTHEEKNDVSAAEKDHTNTDDKETQSEQSKNTEQAETPLQKSVKHAVPFVVQAPHAQWEDAAFQDACEEASMVMANGWIAGKRRISKNDAEEEMEALFRAEEKEFGKDVLDTSAADTARFFTQYYKYPAEVKTNVTMADLYRFLSDDYIVIAPTNGKKLDNPHFTNGGPDRHMLVLIGYNQKKREFITNDPGTRVGSKYTYKDTVLYNAIRDYTTGHKQKIEGAKKNVIIVKK